MASQKSESSWDARIRRATELSSIYPFAAEGLHFYAQLAMLQQKLYSELEHTPAHFFSSGGSGWDRLNSSTLLTRFANFLTSVGQIAPDALAQASAALVQHGPSSWLRLIEEFWRSRAIAADEDETKEGVLAERCLAWLFLQPCAEYLAAKESRVPDGGSPRTCPLCGAKPIVGALRPEGDGARKSLICMFCAHEWAFRRIYCPSCGEEREPHMVFYSAPEIPHVRVDVCETCHTYLKSVDLTKNGLAIPIVDELAALPLDLWARENGYKKLQMNMVGM
jgi:FdhE protein